MEVDNHGLIIYPQNLRKYTGCVQKNRSRAKNGYNHKIISFSVSIRTANFKYYKNFSSRLEAEAELIQQNHENKLEIKNIMQDCSNYYKVHLSNGDKFLADKIDLHFIESHIWYCDNNYVVCKQNKRKIWFHNLIFNHSPTIDSTIDHKNRITLDNRRSNLQIATRQTQMIN